jgi:hypothetical protein
MPLDLVTQWVDIAKRAGTNAETPLPRPWPEQLEPRVLAGGTNVG